MERSLSNHSNTLRYKIFLLIVVLMTASRVNGLCPLGPTISPCTCYAALDEGADVDCSKRSIRDQEMSNILDQFLKPLASPVAYLDFYLNHLTFVPHQITQFNQLIRVDLEFNEISVIRSGDFVFETQLERLVLANNNISVIEPGAFQGVYGNQSEIVLDWNNIRRFESGVFKSVLEQMAPFGGYNSPPRSFTFISMYENPIDCESDPCHLAWLLRDNRDLMGPIYRATCSNGTPFENLDPNAFANCPVTN